MNRKNTQIWYEIQAWEAHQNGKSFKMSTHMLHGTWVLIWKLSSYWWASQVGFLCPLQLVLISINQTASVPFWWIKCAKCSFSLYPLCVPFGSKDLMASELWEWVMKFLFFQLNFSVLEIGSRTVCCVVLSCRALKVRRQIPRQSFGGSRAASLRPR